jgi:hypothetical protein
MLGGNANVTTDGSNFLGPTNVAPIIFKTKPNSTGSLVERMRITPGGRIGIQTKNPVAKTESVSVDIPTALQGTSKNQTSAAVGVKGVGDSGVGVQGDSATNAGVAGNGGYVGTRGQGGSYGVIGSGNSVGVYGSGGDYGCYAVGGAYGAYANGSSYGLYASGPVGVYGSGTTNGVEGTTGNPNTPAVYGVGGQYGVQGVNGRTAGVRGDSGYVGVWGAATSYGVFGDATATSGVVYGVFGQTESASGYAMYAQGNMRVTGTLTKTAGSFQIDHPLDPENKWLRHSFVESPDMMNVYNGNVVLNSEGEATVELPTYFSALNRDFRYQLTTIGAHAPVYVKQEIKNNTFVIAGGSAGLKVSWQVTGIRDDDYAREHPIVVEARKSKQERGTRQFVANGSNAQQFKVVPRHTPTPAPVVPPAPSPVTIHQ